MIAATDFCGAAALSGRGRGVGKSGISQGHPRAIQIQAAAGSADEIRLTGSVRQGQCLPGGQDSVGEIAFLGLSSGEGVKEPEISRAVEPARIARKLDRKSAVA